MEKFTPKDFRNSLLSLDTKSLALVYSLMTDTNMVKMLIATVKDKFFKGNNSFQTSLARSAQEWENQPPEELTIMLLLKLNSMFGISAVHLGTSRDIEDICNEIAKKAPSMMRGIDKNFTRDTFDGFMKYQVEKNFKVSLEQYANGSADEQEKFLDVLKEFVESLPVDQQEKIKREIGVNDLSNEVVHTSLVSGSFASAFAAVVGVGGFPIYMAAASGVSSFFGLVGLTLPFGFYTGMSSSIAVLANPLFLLPLLGVGGFFFLNKSREKVDRMLALTAITQITLAGLMNLDKNVPDRTQEVIALWGQIFDQYKEVMKPLQQARNQLLGVEQKYDQSRLLHKEKVKLNKASARHIEEKRNQLITQLEHMDARQWTNISAPNSIQPSIRNIISTINKLTESNERLRSTKASSQREPSNTMLKANVKALEREARNLKESHHRLIKEMAGTLERQAPGSKTGGGLLNDYAISFSENKLAVDDLIREIGGLVSQQASFEHQISGLKATLKEWQRKKEFYDRRYISIEKIYDLQGETC